MPGRDLARRWLVPAGCVLVLLASMWIANQGGIQAQAPGKFAASIYLILTSLPVLAMLWLGAAGFGYPLRRWLVPEANFGPVIQLGMGMAVLMLLNYVLAWAGLIHAISAWVLPGVGVILLTIQVVHQNRLHDRTGGPPRRSTSPASTSPPRLLASELDPHDPQLASPSARVGGLPWTLIFMMPAVGILLIAATCPPGTLWRVEAFGYDVLSYHLEIPREWLHAGAMIPLRYNVYSFLPGLMEAAYMQIGAMAGSVYAGIYTCQLFHASLGIFAAAAVGCTVANLSSRIAGGAAAAVFISVPWVIITGSLAYNEMAMLAFAAAAVLVLLDPPNAGSERWTGGVVIGLLVGAATLAKPTAGPMLAVPIGLILLTRLNHAIRWRSPAALRKAMIAGCVAAGVGLLTLSPYLIRNFTWTGNPVFPFATGLFGNAHWTPDLVHRFDRAHGLLFHEAHRLESIARQWIFNTGYGAIGGHVTPPEVHNIARFHTEGGFPVLWVAVLVGALLTLWQVRLRRAVAAMAILLVIQLAFWLLATHMQSRFLVPTILPACVIVGLGLAKLEQLTRDNLPVILPAAAIALILALATTSMTVFWRQTRPLPTDHGSAPAPPYLMVDSLFDPSLPVQVQQGRAIVGDMPINHLPPNSKTYLVADDSMLLYIRRPFIYHSAFDASPLGRIIRRTARPPLSPTPPLSESSSEEAGSKAAGTSSPGITPAHARAITKALRTMGITHVWVHWGELRRLHQTYGYDPSVTAVSLRKIAREAHWTTVANFGPATLYQINQ